MTYVLAFVLMATIGYILWATLRITTYLRTEHEHLERTADYIEDRVSSVEHSIVGIKSHQESDDACHGILSMRISAIERRIEEPKKEKLSQ